MSSIYPHEIAKSHNRIGYVTRLKYVLIAIVLSLIGLALMLAFFLIISILFAFAVWAWAGIFIYLAAIGRPYSDFVATLRWPITRKIQ